MLDDSEVVVNQSQGHIDELLTEIVIARLYTQTSKHTDRQTDEQSEQVLDDSEVIVNQSQGHIDE